MHTINQLSIQVMSTNAKRQLCEHAGCLNNIYLIIRGTEQNLQKVVFPKHLNIIIILEKNRKIAIL